MSFRDNLQHLRATRNMTQEQLAMLVGVSRQSVTKWESERAYPEMDKLLKTCQIFGCSLDDLVQGDLTTREPEPELSLPSDALADDVIGYDEHQRGYALRMALGIGAIILGMAAASGVEPLAGDGPAALCFFGGVAVGLALILPAAMGHSAFQKAHPYVADFYTSEQRTEEKRAFGVRLAAGIALILGAYVWGAFTSSSSALETVVGPVFLTCVAAGVGLIVWSALLDQRLDIEEYNISALEDLSEEEIASIVGQDRAAIVLAKVRRSKLKGSVCGVIMLVATAIALPLLFWATSSGNSFWIRYFWVFWMIGGLCCAIASIVIDQKRQ